MHALAALVSLAATLAAAAAQEQEHQQQQQSTFAARTGVRSLWIPFKTVAGTALASVVGNTSATETVYVLSCPRDDAQCALAPNLTVTEGASSVHYTAFASDGSAVLGCALTGSTAAVCSASVDEDGNIAVQTTTLAAAQIAFQAVSVTAVSGVSAVPVGNSTAASNGTFTMQAPTASASPATGGAGAKGGWMAGGAALGAGLLALAAL